MSIFDEDKLIDDAFLEKMGFKHNIDNPKGYFSRNYTHRFSDWGSKPVAIISGIGCYYSRPNNNLYIQRSCWTHKSKKHKVYNQDDFLRALYEHDLIYFKIK
mgnify:CR=1 FL=1